MELLSIWPTFGSGPGGRTAQRALFGFIACSLAKLAGADFVKTSTGFGPGGATAADVALMRRVVGPEMGVKAAGGVRDLKSAQAMLEAGADRIGASVGVKIVQESRGTVPPGAPGGGY